MFRHFRPLFRGPLIANVNMAADRGNRLIEAGLADLVAFGRLYIANPDLVERLATARWQIDWETVYAAGPRGYSDYPPFWPDAMATASISVGLDNASRRR